MHIHQGITRKDEGTEQSLHTPAPPPSLYACDALHCKASAGRNQFIRCIIGLVLTHLAHGLVSNDTVPVVDPPQREIVVLIPLTRVHNQHPFAISKQGTIEARDDAAPKPRQDERCGFFPYVDLGFKPASPACLFAIPVSKLCVRIVIAIQCSA